MATLSNSGRQLLKATHVSLQFDQPVDKLSQAHVKAALVRGLRLQAGEVDAVRSKAANAGSAAVPVPVWATLKQFEPQPVAALMPKASVLADVPTAQLLTFAQAVLDQRIAQLKSLGQPPTPAPAGGPGPASAPPAGPTPSGARGNVPAPSSISGTAPSTAGLGSARLTTLRTPPPMARLAPGAMNAPSVSPAQIQAAIVSPSASLATQTALAASMVTFAKGAMDTFTQAVKISPIGMLHLERIEMEPAGIERGELVATIPLAPGETTSVTQKEWSVTSQDFSSIVTDYLENYSEKGVSEKSELSDSTENESKHSQQLGLSASLSGSYGFVSFATSATANIQDSSSQSSKQSRKDAKETTTKASSRSKKEHKVTIQTSSTVGSSETSTRTLTNPSATSTMRIDYFSMMRKWRVRLLQYGLRLTYDLAIPEPGATLRKLHAQLADLNQKLSGSFTFALAPSDITDDTYQSKADSWGAAVEPPPLQTWSQQFSQTLQNSKDASVAQTLEFDVKEGYAISALTVGGWGSPSEDNLQFHARIALPPSGINLDSPPQNDPQIAKAQFIAPFSGNGLADVPVHAFDGQTGHISIPFMQDYMSSGVLYASVQAVRLDETYRAWQQRVWQTLHDAARDAYYTQVQALAQERDALKAQIEGVDTLTLRREEQEEIMKGVLRWLLGPDFDFMPPDVVGLFSGPTGQSFTSNELGLNADGWTTMFIYQEMVKFIQQAIEWENLLYMVYPYFWDVPSAWDFARTLQHPDPTRQAFLRAGSARVVLTIRSGWEDAFTSFVERGELGQVLPPDHPYLTIGQEIQAYDQTNYPGIPPANPDQEPRPLLTPPQRKAWQDMQVIISLLEAYKTKNGAYPETVQGLATLASVAATQNPPVILPAADPWGNPYQYKSPGKYNDYELASLGADGALGGDGDNSDITSWADSSLIAEWYEYTPTHGLDIAVTSSLPDMA